MDDIAYRRTRDWRLDKYCDALHGVGVAELSAWGAHENLLTMEGVEPVPLPPGFLAGHDTLGPPFADSLLTCRNRAAAGARSGNVWSFVSGGGPEELDDEEVRTLVRLAAYEKQLSLQRCRDHYRGAEDPRALVVAADLTTAANRFSPVNELVASGAALTSGWAVRPRLLERAEVLRRQLAANPLGVRVLTSDGFKSSATTSSRSRQPVFQSPQKQAFGTEVETSGAVADNELLDAFDAITGHSRNSQVAGHVNRYVTGSARSLMSCCRGQPPMRPT